MLPDHRPSLILLLPSLSKQISSAYCPELSLAGLSSYSPSTTWKREKREEMKTRENREGLTKDSPPYSAQKGVYEAPRPSLYRLSRFRPLAGRRQSRIRPPHGRIKSRHPDPLLSLPEASRQPRYVERLPASSGTTSEAPSEDPWPCRCRPVCPARAHPQASAGGSCMPLRLREATRSFPDVSMVFVVLPVSPLLRPRRRDVQRLLRSSPSPEEAMESFCRTSRF